MGLYTLVSRIEKKLICITWQRNCRISTRFKTITLANFSYEEQIKKDGVTDVKFQRVKMEISKTAYTYLQRDTWAKIMKWTQVITELKETVRK